MTPPLAGQPGHGSTAFLRSQPVRIVDGCIQGGYTGVYELICPGCGDHPHLDYSEVPPRLQWLRGPRTLETTLAAYHKHLGLPSPTKAEPEAAGRLGPGYARPGRQCYSMIIVRKITRSLTAVMPGWLILGERGDWGGCG